MQKLIYQCFNLVKQMLNPLTQRDFRALILTKDNSLLTTHVLLIATVLFFSKADADTQQPELIRIAAQEAAIANIGANKMMMLYGVNNPLPVIKQWNQIEQRPALTKQQIAQINRLEQEKQAILKKEQN